MSDKPTEAEVLAALSVIDRAEQALEAQAKTAGIERASVYISEDMGMVMVRVHSNGHRCFPNHNGRFVFENSLARYGKHFDELIEKAGKRIREKAGR